MSSEPINEGKDSLAQKLGEDDESASASTDDEGESTNQQVGDNANLNHDANGVVDNGSEPNEEVVSDKEDDEESFDLFATDEGYVPVCQRTQVQDPSVSGTLVEDETQVLLEDDDIYSNPEAHPSSICISIKRNGASTLNLDVMPNQTVRSVKRRIVEYTALPIESLLLFFQSTRLEDGKRLSEYGIEDDSTIRLMLHLGDTMSVTIKTLTGKVVSMQVRPHHTVYVLKSKIFDSEGIAIDQQRIIFEAKQLEDYATMEDYGIGPGARIHLILKLRGC